MCSPSPRSNPPPYRQSSLDHAGVGAGDIGPNFSEHFGSLDSSDDILASTGSLFTLELLAARGSMRPNGSFSNSVYVNPFDPGSKRRAPSQSSSPQHHRKLHLSSRSRSNDLSDLDLSTLDFLEQQKRARKHRRTKVII